MRSAMTRVSLRNIVAHKLRLALTVLAVVLGTAFIAGSLMFTNMLGNTFDSAVSSQFDGVDAVAAPGEEMQAIPNDVVDELRGAPGVDKLNVEAIETVVAATTDNNPIQTGQGTSTAGIYYPPAEAVGQAPSIAEGREPTALGEAIVNSNAAEKYGIALDQELTIVDAMGRETYRIVGLYDDDMTPSSSLAFQVSPETYTQFYTDGSTVPRVSMSAVEGTTAQQLVDDLRNAHPKLKIDTGEVLAEEATKQIRDALSFVSYFLIAFGLVGLLVGTFLIANTFSMIVAQRTKEFALLRALGASRRQITRSVTIEAFIVGLLGSFLGVVAGVGLVAIIKAVMGANDMPLPEGGLGLSTRAVVVPVVVGVIVTMISAWAPARRAGQVQPVEAMRASESSSPQPLKIRTIIGTVLIVAAIIAAAAGVLWEDGTTANRAILVGVAAVGVIAGLFLAGPAFSLPIVPPLGRLIGAPFGAMGRLASTNTRRNPRRTSATAFALMLGIALVTVIGMLGATMKQSIADVTENEITADYVLTGPQNGSFPIPPDLPSRLDDVDGVGDVVAYSEAPIAINGEFGYQFGPYGASPVFSGDPTKLMKLEMLQGTSSVEGDTIIAPEPWATERGWNLGDKVTLTAPGLTPASVEVTIGGIFAESNTVRAPAIGYETAQKVVPAEALSINMVGVNGDGTVDPEQLRANLEEEVRPDIIVQVRSTEEMAGQVTGLIDQMLFILYALLSLAVIIAVLGIVNTLTLSVIERRQEIGMLRAVGSRRGQIRTMIILESVQMAVFGALLGILMGLGLGWAFLTVLSGQGLEDIVVPWALIGTMLGGTVVVGILAALWPGHRAAKTPPLDAIAD
ncbi:FtsX-like permease family protein [Corynebacterium sanguinis]|uniref:FtsX-like permease family protein n=2 Tax=Corynebacterium sanguinis TaxID=2594913 RepID=A0A838X0A8_9CORY|nr:FtsX-like permease family protein [Corynebacterium sanguinis]